MIGKRDKFGRFPKPVS